MIAHSAKTGSFTDLAACARAGAKEDAYFFRFSCQLVVKGNASPIEEDVKGKELPVFNGFWAGFEPPATGAPTLLKAPEYVDTVTLAFTGPGDDNSYTIAYLCKYYPATTIQSWVKAKRHRIDSLPSLWPSRRSLSD